MKPKKKNPADLTLRNLRAEKRREERILDILQVFVADIMQSAQEAHRRLRILRNDRGEMSVAIILLLTFLSGLGIVVFDHQLSKREREEAAKKIQVEQNVAWENLPNNGEIR